MFHAAWSHPHHGTMQRKRSPKTGQNKDDLISSHWPWGQAQLQWPQQISCRGWHHSHQLESDDQGDEPKSSPPLWHQWIRGVDIQTQGFLGSYNQTIGKDSWPHKFLKASKNLKHLSLKQVTKIDFPKDVILLVQVLQPQTTDTAGGGDGESFIHLAPTQHVWQMRCQKLEIGFSYWTFSNSTQPSLSMWQARMAFRNLTSNPIN